MFPGSESDSVESQHQSQSFSTTAKTFVGNEMIDGKMVGSFKIFLYFFLSLFLDVCMPSRKFFYCFPSIFYILYLRCPFFFFTFR